MKATGIVRKVDELGRVVIPIELRRTLGIEVKDSLEIYVTEDQIVLKKYEASNSCLITGEVDKGNVSLFEGKLVVSKEGARKLIEELEKIV